MSATGQEIEGLVEELDRGRDAGIHGRLEHEGRARMAQADFEGRASPDPWVLRTTQVFRHDAEGWLRLHRHADPLIRFRSPGETLAIGTP
jgi:hypothetical protein